MSPTELAVLLFAVFNGLRVFAYVPQIVAIARDETGARAVSCTTWGLFAASHLSTVAYAALSLGDWRMAAAFGANALCCGLILALAGIKRARFRRDAEARS